MGYNSKDADKLLTNERKLKKGEAPQKILLRSSTTESEETTRGWRIEVKALDAVKGSAALIQTFIFLSHTLPIMHLVVFVAGH